MLKRFCDFCGQEISNGLDDHYELNSICGQGAYTIHSFDACASCITQVIQQMKDLRFPMPNDISEGE